MSQVMKMKVLYPATLNHSAPAKAWLTDSNNKLQDGLTQDEVTTLQSQVAGSSTDPFDDAYNALANPATSTAGGVMPITKVSGENIKQGMVGNITRKIHKLYWDKHSDRMWSTSINDIL